MNLKITDNGIDIGEVEVEDSTITGPNGDRKYGTIKFPMVLPTPSDTSPSRGSGELLYTGMQFSGRAAKRGLNWTPRISESLKNAPVFINPDGDLCVDIGLPYATQGVSSSVSRLYDEAVYENLVGRFERRAGEILEERDRIAKLEKAKQLAADETAQRIVDTSLSNLPKPIGSLGSPTPEEISVGARLQAELRIPSDGTIRDGYLSDARSALSSLERQDTLRQAAIDQARNDARSGARSALSELERQATADKARDDARSSARSALANLERQATSDRARQEIKEVASLFKDFMSPFQLGAIDSDKNMLCGATSYPEGEGNHIKWRGKGSRIQAGYFNPEYVWLGLSRLPIVTQIEFQQRAGTSSIPVPRQQSSHLGASWSSDESLIITVEFPNEIRNKDGSPNTSYDQIAELRTLIAQLRVAPFLPIQWGKRATATVLDIDAVAVEQVIISTVENFPGMYQLQIACVPFNWHIYLKDPDKTAFADYFVWPIFEAYIANVAKKVMPPQAYPEEGVRISVADESKIAAVRKFMAMANPAGGNVAGAAALDPGADTIKSWLDDFDYDIQRLDVDDSSLKTSDKVISEDLWLYQEQEAHQSNGGSAYDSVDWGSDVVASLVETVVVSFTSWKIVRDPAVRNAMRGNTRWRILNDGSKESLSSRFNPVVGTRYAINRNAWALVRSAIQRTKDDPSIKVAREAIKGNEGKTLLSDPKNREIIVFPGMTVGTAQIVITHRFTKLASPGFSKPTLQYWGSPDIKVSLVMASNLGVEGLKDAFGRCLAQRRRWSPMMTDSKGIEPGFMEVQLELLGLLGMRYFTPAGLVPSTVKGIAQREEVKLDLDLFTSIDDDTIKTAKSLTQETIRDQRSIDYNTQMVERLIQTELMLESIPFYPDLFLPTYRELSLWVESVNARYEKIGATVRCQMPKGAQLTNYVDPDFYIASKPVHSEEILATTATLEAVTAETLGVTLTSRLVTEKVEVAGVDGATPVSRPDQYEGTKAKEAKAAETEATGSEKEAQAKQAPTEDVEVETPIDEDTVTPGYYTPEQTAIAAFSDFRNATAFNRLVGAYPTFLTVFYREGVRVNLARMWDQFYGRASVFNLSVTSSMYKAGSSAILSIADPNVGIATSDLEATYNFLHDATSNGSPGSMTVGGGEETVGDQLKRGYFDQAGVSKSTTSWDLNDDTIRRWKDLSNALVISAGTRIHIRAGYGNRLVSMPTIFNGTISDVEISTEELKVISTGDGIEIDVDMLRRLDTTDQKSVEDKNATSWEGVRPRSWILDVLGSYRAPSFRRAAEQKTGVTTDGLLMSTYGENRYGIYHFGNPLTQPNSENPFWKTRWVNRTELGQNIYSSAWAEIDELEREDLTIDMPAIPAGINSPTVDELNTISSTDVFTPGDIKKMKDEGKTDEEINQLAIEKVREKKANEKRGETSATTRGYLTDTSGVGIEDKLTVNTAGKTFFEICTELARCTPGFICTIRPFGIFRSTLFWGKPHWDYSYNYIRKTDPRFGVSRTRAIRNVEIASIAEKTKGASRAPDLPIPNAPAPIPKEVAWESPTVKLGENYSELIKPLAQWHFADTSWNIVKMGIRTTADNVYTRCRCYGLMKDGSWKESEFGSSYTPGEQVLIVNVDDDISPESVREIDIATPFRWKFGSGTYARRKGEHYAQERLAEGCRTMYDGHILLLGDTTINPWDVIQMNDSLTQTKGIFTVREVTHHIGMDTGFITDVKPGAIAWGACAPQNTRSVTSNWAVSSMVSTLMSTHAMRVESMQHLVTSGRGLMHRSLQAIETFDLPGIDEDREVLYNAMIGLSRSSSDGEIRNHYSKAIEAIKSVLAKMTKGVNNIRIVRGQMLSPVDIVVHLNETIKRLRGTAEQNKLSLIAVASTAKGSSASGAEAARAAIEDVDHERIEMSIEQFRAEGSVDSATKAKAVALKEQTGQGVVIFDPLTIIAKGIAWMMGRDRDGVNIFVLTRAGRELSAGINNHRGCVVGEAGSAWNQIRGRLKRWVGMGTKDSS